MAGRGEEAERVETAGDGELLVLGPVAVRAAGVTRSPSSPVARAVLGALALAGHGGLPDRALFERVWGAREARPTESTLTVAISRLRSWLRETTGGAIGIRRTAAGYALEPAGDTDVARFRRLLAAADGAAGSDRADSLAAALALWRDGALADVPAECVDEAAVARLERQRVGAAIDYARGLLAGGNAELAVDALAEAAARHPLDESLLGVYIEALAASGRQGEALERYERLRLRLRDELGVDPSRELSSTLVRVLRQEVTTTGDAPATDATVVPAELPGDVATFTGRADELARLDALLDGAAGADPAHTVVVSAVTGMGGIGKTAFAVHWAHRTAERFPDGQLYADLRGYSQRGPEPGIGVLGRFLRSLGVPGERVPAELDEAAALYRSLLANRRMLVVLDNAAGAEQVRPLLPSAPGCLALVTSRDRLDGLAARDGAYRLPLDVLTADEAIALLRRIIGSERVAAEPQAAASIAKLCGHLPLALRVTAAQLTARPASSLTDHRDRLARRRLATLSVAGDEQTDVRATFDLSYERLSEIGQRLFRMVGTAPCGDVTAGSAVALAGIDRDTAADTLELLATGHLVTEHEPGRYTLHDLLRAYARERATDEDGDADIERAIHRLLDWYEAATVQVANRLDPHLEHMSDPTRPAVGVDLPDRDTARAWLATEAENIMALIRWAAANGPHPFAWRLMYLLRSDSANLDHGDERRLGETVRAAAERAGDVRGLAAAERAMTNAYQDSGDVPAMLRYGERALAHVRESGWTTVEPSALGALGTACALSGDFDRAVALLRQAVESSHRYGQQRGEAVFTGNLGLAYQKIGPMTEAIACARRAIDLFIELDLARNRARQLGNLGEAHMHAGRLEAARSVIEAALELCHAHSAWRIEADVREARAKVDRDLGRYEDAYRQLESAMELADKLKYRRLQTSIMVTLASIECRTDAGEKAREHLDQALADSIALENPELEMMARLGLADAHRWLGNNGHSLSEARHALAIAHEHGMRVLESDALTSLAQTHLARGGFGDAAADAREATRIQRVTGQRIGEARAEHVLGDALHASDGARDAIPHWRRAHALYTESGLPEAERLGEMLRRYEEYDDAPVAGG